MMSLMTGDAHESASPPTAPPEHVASHRQLLVAQLGIGLFVGLLLGSFALISGVWLLAFTPLGVVANRYLAMRAGATQSVRVALAWPVMAIAVASAVFVIVPDSAVPAVVIVAAVLLPVLLIVAAAIDTRTEGTVWRY